MKNGPKNRTNGLIPNSFKFISSCIKTVSTNVRSAGASVAGSISGDSEHRKDQVLWACFDRLEFGPSIKHVLLLGYSNGFQVFDVEDASNVCELVSKRDASVTFLQMQPTPANSGGCEGYRASHPLLLVVATDDTSASAQIPGGRVDPMKNGCIEPQTGNVVNPPTAVRFYSLRSHNYVHVLRFRSTVYMVRCSSRVVAVGLAAQIYCFDAVTLESKFSVLTYPVPQLRGQGNLAVNIGYGPMTVGPKWLAYASNSPLLSNTGRLSPQSLTPSPGVSPSTSPGNGHFVARYAMESSKHLAAGLINLGDMGYKTLSKYYQDLLPDGSSSPVSSNPSWKVGLVGAHPPDAETAGMVVIKDIESRAVVSQFRAHTSPISALCFDPSGTLLVTTSIQGTNINIFRIMPSCSKNGSGITTYDWSSSHVHLYKLHRGMTPAVIQDICFNHYSQWIAIVSSRGTCHVFVLSPFGGESTLQLQSSGVDGPKLSPSISLPWWFTPSFLRNQPPPPPPPPVTLSVVSRIKNITGWLNAVNNAASSATGKVSVPSGAISAVFHNSIPSDAHPAHLNMPPQGALEYLLVFTPSGHLIQHQLIPSQESSETVSKTGSGMVAAIQDDELHVKVEPVQWWDVCRGIDWPEKEESLTGITCVGQKITEMGLDVFNGADYLSGSKSSRSHLYISNAEVQINSGRVPVSQKSKIHFYALSVGANERCLPGYCSGGEIEIERIPGYEVELRRKDLLPAFEHFQRVNSNWFDRDLVGRYPNPSSKQDRVIKKISEDAAVSEPKEESSGTGFSRATGIPGDSDPANAQPSFAHAMSKRDDPSKKENISVPPRQSLVGLSLLNRSSTNGLSVLESKSLSSGQSIASEVQASNSAGNSDASNTSSNRSDLSMNILDGGTAQDALYFDPYFQDGYYKPSDADESRESAELVADVDSSSCPCDREKSEEDGENVDMLGSVFTFSEEG